MSREFLGSDVVREEFRVWIGDAVERTVLGIKRHCIYGVSGNGNAEIFDHRRRLREIHLPVALRRRVGVDVPAGIIPVLRLDVVPELPLDGAASVRHVARQGQQFDFVQSGTDENASVGTFRNRMMDTFCLLRQPA